MAGRLRWRYGCPCDAGQTKAGMVYLASTLLLALLISVATAWDMRSLRIPDPLNLILILSGVIVTLLLQRSLWDAVIGAVAGYGVIWAVNELYRRRRGRDGIGMGDAKMLAGAGAWVGWIYLPFVVLAASLLGVGYALVRGLRRTAHVPFGPFIGVALLAVWLATGPWIQTPP